MLPLSAMPVSEVDVAFTVRCANDLLARGEVDLPERLYVLALRMAREVGGQSLYDRVLDSAQRRLPDSFSEPINT